MRELVARDAEARWLDRYELLAEIATGGMATVYLARASGAFALPKFVAIKRLHPHLAYEPEFVEMLMDEARLLARIHHPNVVPILEIGSSRTDGHYIVMEYVEGGTLGRLLVHAAESHRVLPLKVGLRIVLDMLQGLQAAHDLTGDDGKPLGIVHRDISPQNVLAGVDGRGRLGDFGVARARGNPRTTRDGQLKGKLAYMAPEQAHGYGDIDRRADIFAAGVVLWEVLTCRRLFKGDGEVDTLNKVLRLPIPPMRAVAPTVPAVLEAVVAKALQRDPEKRLASAAELAEALERSCRVLGAEGTSKDVAAHIAAALGEELKLEREGVEAWVGSVEPRPLATTSAPSSLSVMPAASDAQENALSWSWALAAFAAFGAVALGFSALGRTPRSVAAAPCPLSAASLPDAAAPDASARDAYR